MYLCITCGFLSNSGPLEDWVAAPMGTEEDISVSYMSILFQSSLIL